MAELYESSQNAVIKVIGIGGGGCNAVDHMVDCQIEGVEFIAVNTDAQALARSRAPVKIQIGAELTRGLGAGADPEKGRAAAEADADSIRDLLSGSDMVFLTAGMGGGTGTGAAPVFAEIARELGILTVAVVTKPFPFEGKVRHRVAEEGIAALRERVDSLITIPNARLLEVLGKTTSLLQAFAAADDVLRGAVQGIAELITVPGLINVDFADVKTVMSQMGMAMMGTGSASGADRARKAAEQAIASPLLDNVELKGARGILVNITGGLDLSIEEFQVVGDMVHDLAAEDAQVVVGTVIDHDLQDEVRVTVVATGLSPEEHEQKGESALTTPSPSRRKAKKTLPWEGEEAEPPIEIPKFLRRRAGQD